MITSLTDIRNLRNGLASKGVDPGGARGAIAVFQRNRIKQRQRIWYLWHKDCYRIKEKCKTMFLMSTEPSMGVDNQFSRDISNMFPDSIVPKDTENPIGNESKNSHGAFRIVHIPFKDQQSTNLDNLLRIESSTLSLKVHKRLTTDNTGSIPFLSTTKVNYDNYSVQSSQEESFPGIRREIEESSQVSTFNLSYVDWLKIKPET